MDKKPNQAMARRQSLEEIDKQLATAEKDYNDGDYGQAGTGFQQDFVDTSGRQGLQQRRQVDLAAAELAQRDQGRLPLRKLCRQRIAEGGHYLQE